MFIKNFTIMDCIAIWGAITGSIAICLDVFRYYQDRPILSFNIIPKGELMPGTTTFFKKDEGNFMVFDITNTGKRATTLTHVVFRTYPNKLAYLLRKPDSALDYYTCQNKQLPSLPFALEPGKMFHGFCARKSLVSCMKSTSKIFTIEAQHSLSKKTIRKRIKL